jgi:hypothetical protein
MRSILQLLLIMANSIYSHQSSIFFMSVQSMMAISLSLMANRSMMRIAISLKRLFHGEVTVPYFKSITI